MKKLLIFLVITLYIGLCATASLAQDYDDYKQQKGYVDFSEFDYFRNKEKKVEVSLKGPLLNFITKAASENDPEAAKLFGSLKALTVAVFEINNGQAQEVENIISDVSGRLKACRWDRIVRVKDKGNHVEIFTLISENLESFEGLVVMVLNETEAVFVNIVGNIDPNQLGKLGGKFNIPNLTEVMENSKSSKH